MLTDKKIHYPDSLIVNPNKEHKYTVIWLHGLGSDASDFFSLLPQLQFKNKDCVKFIFPNASQQKVSINASMIMPSWYDIYNVDNVKSISIPDLKNSSLYIKSLIDDEIKLTKQIILAGFSQGGVVAIHTALCGILNQTIKSVLALSTYHPNTQLLKTAEVGAAGVGAAGSGVAGLDAAEVGVAEVGVAGLDVAEVGVAEVGVATQIYFMHGEQDATIPIQLAKDTCKKIKQLNYKTQFTSYTMAHELCQKQIKDINNFFSVFCV